jgi:hypothetical protein
MYSIINQVFDIGVACQEPQQFVDYALQKYLFCGEKRESILKIESHLMTENATCSRTCAITLYYTLRSDTFE